MHGHLVVHPLICVVVSGRLAFQTADLLGVLILHAIVDVGQRPRIERVLIQIGIRDHTMAGAKSVHLCYNRLQQMPHFLLPHVFALIRHELTGLFKPQVERRFPRADAKDGRHVAAADGDGDRAIGPVRPRRKPSPSVHARGIAQYLRCCHQ